MIPILGDEARKIQRSQVMRGVERVRGWRGSWLRLSSLIVPLSSAVIRRAEHLGEALVSRGITGETVSSKKPLRLTIWDWAFLATISVGIVLMLLFDRWGGRLF